MKLNILKRGSFYVAALTTLTFVSCTPDENSVAPAAKGDINELDFDRSELTTKYNKVIKVTDVTGESVLR